MQIYWIKETGEQGIFELTEGDVHHCMVVMRHRIGDRIWGTDGKGNAYELEIMGFQKDKVIARALAHHPNLGEPRLPTAIAFALLKNSPRMEMLIEKAVELGATHIFPFVAKRSEKKNISLERVQRILIAAIKQCKRSKMPVVQFYPSLKDLLLNHSPWNIPKFIGYCESRDYIGNYQSILQREPSFFIIGPEGDFTSEEIALAKEHQVYGFSLGDTRLRAETAALHVLSINLFSKHLANSYENLSTSK